MADLDIETSVPTTACWECGHRSDAASGATTPKPGDFTLCINCGALSVFADDLAARPPTDDEVCEATKIPDVRRFREAIYTLKAVDDG